MSATVCQLTIKPNSRVMMSSDGESSTRLVLDQNSSKVHGCYSTSLYTASMGKHSNDHGKTEPDGTSWDTIERLHKQKQNSKGIGYASASCHTALTCAHD